MIAMLVDWALESRFLVLAGALMPFVWRVVSFHRLPVEDDPDVANNSVKIVMQWPGRAAEEVEHQVMISIETVMKGRPHLEHLRSAPLSGSIHRARSPSSSGVSSGASAMA